MVFSITILALDVDPGPFAPVVGYIGAIIGAIACIRVIVWGRKQIWKTPDDSLPDTISKVVGILSGVGMVLIWLSAEPSVIGSLISLAITLIVLLVVSYLLYHFLIVSHTYEQEVVISKYKTQKVKVLGGLWLTDEAKDIKKQKKCTIQELIEGAANKLEKVWDNQSRSLLKNLLMFLFMVIIVTGTLGISTVGFIVQVKLTDKPAAAILDQEKSPGLEKK